MSVQDFVAIAGGKHHVGETTVDQPIENEGQKGTTMNRGHRLGDVTDDTAQARAKATGENDRLHQ